VLAASNGKLDVLVNNAGIASAGVSEGFTPDQVRDLFEVNVFGVQRMLRAALPTLRRQGFGLVVTTGSILGRVTFPFFGLYGASKFALEAMIDSYAYELSQLGIEFVLVQPSAYPTNMYASVQQPVDPGRTGEYGEIGQIPARCSRRSWGCSTARTPPTPTTSLRQSPSLSLRRPANVPTVWWWAPPSERTRPTPPSRRSSSR
jgi:NAD(P)-dependent dehydrogenase (short-subunit alcohol dehydrogenase family)